MRRFLTLKQILINQFNFSMNYREYINILSLTDWLFNTESKNVFILDNDKFNSFNFIYNYIKASKKIDLICGIEPLFDLNNNTRLVVIRKEKY